eukprot:TRINITY_DN54_c0_g1_i5.p2 TRINITY_DN54_c0_g1~~TRINITY_DN54_c0_g1_i5.p2  ORF type:complete len:123 (-),score=4.50 TRINITY_DN54_c0_g1_i5:5-373(-)
MGSRRLKYSCTTDIQITGTQKRICAGQMAIPVQCNTLPRKAVMYNKVTVPQTDTGCLLYTSDAADDMQCVDLGGRRIIKKKKKKKKNSLTMNHIRTSHHKHNHKHPPTPHTRPAIQSTNNTS